MRLARSLLSFLPFAIGALSLGITAWLWNHERLTTQRALKAAFDFGVRQTTGRIEQRMASYEQMLRGAQGLLLVSDRIDRDDFQRYAGVLQAGADFAGVQWLGYSPLTRGAAGEASAKVAFVAPATSVNLSAVGNDAYADPSRRAAMRLAQDSGGVGITPRLDDMGGAAVDTPPGFVMFLPVYARGAPTESVAQRRAAIVGWVSCGIRMSDLMSSLYGEGTPGLEVRVHDGVDVRPATLMYQSASRGDGAPAPRFETLEYIGFAGHTWTVDVSAQPQFEQRSGADAARVMAISGIGVSLLLALLTHLLVTARQRAHETALAMTRELRDSEERYRRIVETADEGILVTDSREQTSFVNPKMARMLDYSVAEMLGRPPADFRDEPGPAAEDPGAPAAGDVSRESRFRRRDGSTLWASMTTTPIVDAAGQRVGALAMVTDITGKKQADASRAELEAQLRESQKMQAIGTLAGGIAHDFNNILAAILGNVALARHDNLDAATQGRLEQINRSASRARSLVQQILAFSRRQPHSLVVQPLRPLIEESVRLLRPILPARVELEVTLADTPMSVKADATQMHQVVLNLCTNAWHALGGGPGRIAIGLEALALDRETAQGLGLTAGPHARLAVSDTGCGMDENTRARAFEPFFTTKPVGQGTGLGLSVVHGIVATHHGAITLNTAPRRGSRFDVYLPLLAADAPVVASAPAAPVGPRAIARHVVYLDDDPVMGLMVEGLLERAGHRVTCFQDPRAAIATLRAQPDGFDLVITDYNMPGLSGLDVARELAGFAAGLPVVLTSGYVSDEVLAAARELGVRHVMQKEYTLEQLADVVQRVLGERAAPAEAPA